MPETWRIFVICSIKPLADSLVGALRDLGHEPVALLAPRRDSEREMPPHIILTDASAPKGLDLLFARDKHAIEPLHARLRARPDALLGLPLEDPAGRARRAAARLGQPASGPAAAPSRPDPARLGDARR